MFLFFFIIRLSFFYSIKILVITDRWKGMNQTQIDSIRETQASQVQERKMREDEAARLQKEWDTNRPGLIFANQL